MNHELTIEQQEQIAKLVDQAREGGLLDQAISSELSPEEQKKFQQIMLDRVNKLLAETDKEQQWFTYLSGKETDDFEKRFTKFLCEQLCDTQGQLKKEYQELLLNGQHEKFITTGISLTVFICEPSLMGYDIALFMMLYFIREGVDQLCSDYNKADG
ncbi:hypothetical protein BGP_0478 [Beggiatoa sp. PS]|nr:hypothetical protein BGP_0478 [Beggiatoa sp. PS]